MSENACNRCDNLNRKNFAVYIEGLEICPKCKKELLNNKKKLNKRFDKNVQFLEKWLDAPESDDRTFYIKYYYDNLCIIDIKIRNWE